MDAQLELSLVENIKRSHQEALECANAAIHQGNAAILKARECGQYLLEAKQAVGHGNWQSWFSAHVRNFDSPFSQDTAARWMKLADASMEELIGAQGLRQAYIALGIIPQPQREAGSQQAHGDGARWLTALMKATEHLTKYREEHPDPSQWRETDRITMKERLRPLAELYAQL